MRSVARAHDIPANQLFHWRKLYREGLIRQRSEQATHRNWWRFGLSASSNNQL